MSHQIVQTQALWLQPGSTTLYQLLPCRYQADICNDEAVPTKMNTGTVSSTIIASMIR